MYDVESEAEELYEFATQAQWEDLYPPTCRTREARADWCVQNLERFQTITAEAPTFMHRIASRVSQKFQETNLMQGAQTNIISAFPGTGKSWFNQHSGLATQDSDSSHFSWVKEGVRHPDFPGNYLLHIARLQGKVDLVFVSTHAEVLAGFTAAAVPFSLVYPARELKAEYLRRYQERGSPAAFLTLVDQNWDTWLSALESHPCARRFVLPAGQYLSDIVERLR